MFSLGHYWTLRSMFIPGLVRAISGRTLGKYSFDDVVILCRQRFPSRLRILEFSMELLRKGEIILGQEILWAHYLS